MARTRYYDPKASGIMSIVTWEATVFQMVLKRKEFYVYILWNLVLTSGFMFAVPDNKIQEFNWDAASIMQYVMTFFVTFYNDMCYTRYQRLYPAITEFADSVMDMVESFSHLLHWPALKKHRIACSKYLLAILYEHFLMVCGGRLHEDGWDAMIKKGLLSEAEVALLIKFPGGRASPVICCWVLFVVKDALYQTCMWRKDADGNDVSQQTVHIYNRFAKQLVHMEMACNKIGYEIANPIPFAYYHLMNFILLFNILLLATFSALFKSYATTLPFGMALLVYMSLREVSTALADPFGEDAVDFDIQDILRACYDRTVCHLFAFQKPEVRAWVLDQVKHVEDFEERHLRRSCNPTVFNDTPGSMNRGPPALYTKWGHDSPFEDAALGVDLKRRFKYGLFASGPPLEEEEEEEAIDEEPSNAKRQERLTADIVLLEKQCHEMGLVNDDVEFESARLGLVLQELMFKFPELQEFPPPGGDDEQKSEEDDETIEETGGRDGPKLKRQPKDRVVAAWAVDWELFLLMHEEALRR